MDILEREILAIRQIFLLPIPGSSEGGVRGEGARGKHVIYGLAKGVGVYNFSFILLVPIVVVKGLRRFVIVLYAFFPLTNRFLIARVVLWGVATGRSAQVVLQSFIESTGTGL